MFIAERLSSLASAPNMNIPFRYIAVGLTLTIGISFPVHASAVPALHKEVGIPIYQETIIQPISAVKINQMQELVPETPPPVVGAVNGCGDNEYANYIYMHESGCNTTAVNSIGCTGIGQACPASKLTSVCPNLDYACENAWFTDYANRAYGGWAGAYQKWIASHWW